MSEKNLNPVNKESKEIFKSSEAESQTAPAIVNPMEPESESWSYMGPDSTSFTKVDIVNIDDDNRESVNTWMGKIKHPKKGQSANYDQIIKDGIELIKDISCDANMLINVANKNFADRAISIGLICHKLKALIRGNKKPWAVWAEENLPFIAKRNREKYMLLASRPDCWPVSFLGVDRMEMLCSVTRDMEGTDRISELFKNYAIPFDENMEINMSEFKAKIDAAINNERLTNNGLMINFNLVTNIVNLGVDFDKSMITRLKDIRDCGGNPETLLERLMLTGGKEDMEVTPEKRLQDFNHLSSRLIKTLEVIMSDQDQLVKIDRDTFAALMEKLISIQELGILGTDEEEAA
jgi:hypothetical protein